MIDEWLDFLVCRVACCWGLVWCKACLHGEISKCASQRSHVGGPPDVTATCMRGRSLCNGAGDEACVHVCCGATQVGQGPRLGTRAVSHASFEACVAALVP